VPAKITVLFLRAASEILGSTDGRALFESLLAVAK
jgi:hypothetical protein